MAVTAATLNVLFQSQGADQVKGDLRGVGQAVDETGKSFTGFVAQNRGGITTLGKAMLGVGGALTGLFVGPMIAGSKAAWGQVGAVQQATIAMGAYEKDASKVEKTLGELVAYARSDMGVLFQRQDLFEAAQGLLIAGDATESLTGHVEIMSRAVGLGMIGWDDLTRVIQRVGQTGKLAGYDFDMLTKAGYRLDPALRNTKITWDELFTALDQGMPADALAGQATTIRGKMIRLQSAIRNLGLEFLGVNKDTSEFIKGGLGDTLMKGLSQAREAFLAMAPAAAIMGSVVATVARAISGLIDWVLKLPQPILTGIVTMGALTGVLLTMGGTFLLLLPRIVATVNAFKTLRTAAREVDALAKAMRLLGLSSPLMIGLGVAVAAFLAYKTNFLGFRDAVHSVIDALKGLGIVQAIAGWFQNLLTTFAAFSKAVGSLQTKKTIDVSVKGDDKYIQWVEQEDGATKYMVMHLQDDGSVKEFGEIIESYDDENDPNIAHIHVQGEDGDYWTTVRKDTGEIADGTITIKGDDKDARSTIDRLRDGLRALAAQARTMDMPFVAALAEGAITALGWVEKLRVWFDGLNPVFKQVAISALLLRLALIPLAPVIGAIASALAVLITPVGLVVLGLAALAAGLIYAYTHVKPFHDAVNALGAALKTLFAGNLGAGFAQLGKAIASLDAVILGGIAKLAGGLQGLLGKAFASLSKQFPAFRAFFGTLGTAMTSSLGVVKNLARAFESLLRGDVSGFFENLGRAGMDAARAIGASMLLLPALILSAIRLIPWGAIGSSLLNGGKGALGGLESLAAGAWDWFVSSVAAIPWGTIGSTMANLLRAALNGAGSAMSGLWTWLTSSLQSALNSMSVALGRGIQLAWDAITSLNWGDWIGRLAWDAFVTVLEWAQWIGGKIADIAVWVWDKIKGYFPAAAVIAGSIKNVATWLWDQLKGFFPSGSVIAGAIANIATWLWEKLKGFFPSGAVITGTIGDLAAWLYEKIGAPKVHIPKWPGWEAFFDYINPFNHISKQDADTINRNEAQKAANNDKNNVGKPDPNVTPVAGDKAKAPVLADQKGVPNPDLPAWVKFGVHLSNVANMAQVTARQIVNLGLANDTVRRGVDQFSSSLSLNSTALGRSATILSPLPGLIGNVAGAAVGVAVPAFNAILGGAQTAFGGIPPLTAASFGAMAGSVLSNTAKAATSAIGNTASMAAGVAGNAANMASRAIGSATNANSGVSGQMVGMQVSAVAKAATMAAMAGAQAQNMANQLTGGARQGTAGVLAGLAPIPGIVASIGGAAASIAYSIGANIGNSVAAGMLSALGAIAAAAAAIIATAQAALLAKAMIASPSKLFRKDGVQLPAGTALGIEDGLPFVKRAVDQLFDVMTPPDLATRTLVSLPGVRDGSAAGGGRAGGGRAPVTVYVGGITIYQQPGESSDALTSRLGGMLRETLERVS